MKVLIADNNNRIRKFIKEIISELECEIIEATDGQSALENFQIHAPDVVLLDLNLDVVDGIEVAEFIRKNSADTKIIITSDYNDKLIMEKALSAGANECLPKGNLITLNSMLLKIHQAN